MMSNNREILSLSKIYMLEEPYNKYSPNKNIVQLDNGLVLTILKNNTDLSASL